MAPQVNITLSDRQLHFTLSHVDVSIANAIRRTALSNIVTPVFLEEDMNFLTNTSRLHNEILKQRLACIPIHINDVDIKLENYVVEITKKNEGGSIEYVTTEDFKIKNIENEKYLTDAQTKQIFPSNKITKDFILFARLRPQITKDIPGEKIDIRAKISTSNAKNNGMYNVVSTMTYSNTVDPIAQHAAWQKYTKQLQKLEIDGETLAFEKTNWENHQGKRYYMKNSFDFIVETVGNFTNDEIIKMSCEILIKKLQLIIKNKDQFSSKESENNLSNSFDIILKNEDYTIGKVIESILYHDYFLNTQQLGYVGFMKKHPHDNDSVVRIAFVKETTSDEIFPLIAECCLKGIEIFKHIMSSF